MVYIQKPISLSTLLFDRFKYVIGIAYKIADFKTTNVEEIFKYIYNASNIYLYLFISFILIAFSKIRSSIHNMSFSGSLFYRTC